MCRATPSSAANAWISPPRRVLADDVEPKVAATIGEDAQRTKQRTLILDAIEARDVHEPRLLAMLPADRRSHRPTL